MFVHITVTASASTAAAVIIDFTTGSSTAAKVEVRRQPAPLLGCDVDYRCGPTLLRYVSKHRRYMG